MNLFKSHKPQRSALWKATLLFIFVSGILIAADQLSTRLGLDGSQRIVDDLLGGLITGSIFYLYERHRLRRFSEHLHVIDLMNHHIRNALHPLMFVRDEPEGKAQMKLVEECVRRIDWALREVLPGKSEEQSGVTPADSLEEAAKHRAASSSSGTERPAGICKQSAKQFFSQLLLPSPAWRSLASIWPRARLSPAMKTSCFLVLPGTGKSPLAQAAIPQDYRVLSRETLTLLDEIADASGGGRTI